MKQCSKCKELKDKNYFTRNKNAKDGFEFSCKECRQKYYKKNKEKIKEQQKNSVKVKERKKAEYEKNKEAVKEDRRRYRKNNREKVRALNKEYYKNNTERLKMESREYRENNPDKIREMIKNYREKTKDDRNKNIKLKIHNRIRQGFRRFVNEKDSVYKSRDKTFDILGYSYKELKQHLESKFEPGMNWDNMGRSTNMWAIDHIVPISWFNCSVVKDIGFKQCFCLDNLQPLWSKENSVKGNRYAGKPSNPISKEQIMNDDGTLKSNWKDFFV